MKDFLLRGLATALMAAVLAIATPASAQLIDSQSPSVRLSAEERRQWQSILDQRVPSDLPKPQLIGAYARKNTAALRLGDMAARERVLREWAAIDFSGKRVLRGALSGTDKHEEAITLGEAMVAEEKGGWPLAILRLEIARDLTLVGRYARARVHIEAAEKLLPGDLSRLKDDELYYALRVQAVYYQVKSQMLRIMGNWQQSTELARLGLARSLQMVDMRQQVRDEGARFGAVLSAFRAYTDLARSLTAAGLYAEAEWCVREAYQLLRRTGTLENLQRAIFSSASEYYAAVGQYKEALSFIDRATAVADAEGLSASSGYRRQLDTRRLEAMVGQARWTEASRMVVEIDAAIRASGAAPTLGAYEQRLRTLVALHNGQHAGLPAVLRPIIERNGRIIGPDHYNVAIDRGLLAAALAKSGAIAEAKPLFAQAVRGLTAPASLTGDFTENAFQRQTKRYVLQTYMHLLARSAKDSPQDALTLFEVADQLTTSSVQQALSEAAVRSGVTQPALAEIIRKEQDAKQEIAALTSVLLGQGGEGSRRPDPQQVDQARDRIRELEDQRRGYKAQIQKEFPEYFQLVQPRPPSPAEIARQLRPNELFIVVTPMTDTTYAWAIDAGGGVRFHDAGIGEGQLRTWVDRVRRTLDLAGFEDGKVPAFAFADAHRIYQAIFAPFEREIAGKKHLVVSTAGSLAQLPFAVLPRKPHAGTLADAPWLLKDVAVSHVPSANGWLALKRLQQVPVAQEPLMAWGDPVFDLKRASSGLGAGIVLASASAGVPVTDVPTPSPPMALAAAGGPGSNGLRQAPKPVAENPAQRNVTEADTYVVYSKIPPLPETRDEVQVLARILGANPARDLVLGEKATRQSVIDASKAGTLAKKRVVVFATHGLLAGDLPDLNQPALAMAANADAKASPLLTLEDVLGLKLNADWVVLSACNTAGADGRAQEAMSGLARGFFYAGSRSLLVTHWSVESQSAMLLTTNTFEAYAKDPAITRAEALRQAMLKVMAQSQYQHPAFWAPYALVGEGGR